jgi:hypothetical protein
VEAALEEWDRIVEAKRKAQSSPAEAENHSPALAAE